MSVQMRLRRGLLNTPWPQQALARGGSCRSDGRRPVSLTGRVRHYVSRIAMAAPEAAAEPHATERTANSQAAEHRRATFDHTEARGAPPNLLRSSGVKF